MGLKKAFFLLAVMCLLGSLLLTAAVWAGCSALRSAFPAGGIAFGPDGMITYLEEPTGEQRAVSAALGYIQIFSCILFPVCGLAGAGALFYRLKCRAPIMILQEGVLRIRKQDLDFAIPVVSDDELGQLCAAFETMRAELLKSNQELWRQAEERKRLNAAFSHDLRNPVTVLKGTVKQLRQGTADEQALSRLESYTLRIEQYVEVMGSIQRLEQMPVCKRKYPVLYCLRSWKKRRGCWLRNCGCLSALGKRRQIPSRGSSPRYIILPRGSIPRYMTLPRDSSPGQVRCFWITDCF